jgi:hypothetical protein
MKWYEKIGYVVLRALDNPLVIILLFISCFVLGVKTWELIHG